MASIYLASVDSPLGPRFLNNVSLSVNLDSTVMFWHQHLWHPSFIYLKALHPHLFMNKDIHSFRYEHCICAKQFRKHYPIQPYKSSKPFHLIHDDIWGPTHSSNLSGTRWFISLSMITLESLGLISWETNWMPMPYSDSFINLFETSSNHQAKSFALIMGVNIYVRWLYSISLWSWYFSSNIVCIYSPTK